jgi:hypothetical protein
LLTPNENRGRNQGSGASTLIDFGVESRTIVSIVAATIETVVRQSNSHPKVKLRRSTSALSTLDFGVGLFWVASFSLVCHWRASANEGVIVHKKTSTQLNEFNTRAAEVGRYHLRLSWVMT